MADDQESTVICFQNVISGVHARASVILRPFDFTPAVKFHNPVIPIAMIASQVSVARVGIARHNVSAIVRLPYFVGVVMSAGTAIGFCPVNHILA